MSNPAYCIECNRIVEPTITARCPRCDRQLESHARQRENTRQANIAAFHEWAVNLHAALDAHIDSQSK